ncbi:MAG TPA: recombinase family protein [Xanthobacteraceae bacterium]|jgi:DNA invertase Pin-like site-specific DNA recombinase
MSKSKRVAISARVSTDDKGQETDNQLVEVRQWAASAGYDVVGEYVDHISGRKGTDGRKQFAALFADASKRKFDLVLFWSLDRFSRPYIVAQCAGGIAGKAHDRWMTRVHCWRFSTVGFRVAQRPAP